MSNKIIWCMLFFISTLNVNSFADTATPETPSAYEPFILKLEVPMHGTVGLIRYVVNYDFNNNTILIGYLNYGGHFIPLPSSLITLEIQGLPPGTYTLKTAYMPDLADGDVVIEDSPLTISVSDAPPTQPVHALFHPGIEHFFVTASQSEADGLLDQNWEYVDFGFNVWSAEGSAPDAALPVCRFYSSLVNSHFYTASEEECDYLQSFDSGWEYEGIAFRALVPIEGACPAGTDPVWRLFNNRADIQDSNHRFVASGETYRTMIADGWVGEGVAFCSPPSASE